MLSTKRKIFIAKKLSQLLLFFRRMFGLSDQLVCTRRGVSWLLNLNEGIDLSIYLLGGFEVDTLNRYQKMINPGDIVFDICANIGAHTLPLAALVGDAGRVYSFEPTKYAFSKQIKNIDLNPELKNRISASQIMLTATPASMPNEIYSSWPLDDVENLHEKHLGKLMSTQDAEAQRLDDFVDKLGITKVAFIKLDVDGNELDVLRGAVNTIKKSKPKVMIELAPYVFENRPADFDDMLNLFWDQGYQFTDISSGKQLPQSVKGIKALIPKDGCLNVMATYIN
jgi:hypothetical protein